MEALRSEDPSVIAGYRMLARLGAGGMGRVYLARSPGGRPVAFKVIRSDFADDPDFRVRFAREVAAARSVSGVFTAPVLDADPQGDPPWLATGYVAGVALNDAVTRFGPLPGSLRQLAGGLAEALAAVHAAGLVHRDLKPANVMLAADGPRLIDFGIARALEGGTITRTGFLVGSPGFLAPEQAGSGAIGPGTDVFALGSVLTYAATGQSPFGEGVFTELLFKVLYGEPDVSGVPEPFRPLVAAMLAKEPADRPTPGQILDRLAESGPDARAGAWLPRPVTELVLARSAALLAEDPLVRPAAETVVEHPRSAAPAPPAPRPVPHEPIRPEPAPERPPPVRQSPGQAVPSQVTAPQSAPPPAPRVTPASPASSSTTYRGHTPSLGPPHGASGGTTGSPDRNRKRRAVVAVVAVAALAVAAAVITPRLLDDDKDPKDSSSAGPPGTPSGGTPGANTPASPANCGAVAANFTGTTVYPQISTPTDGIEPEQTAAGYVITAGPESDVRVDFQGKVTAPFASAQVNGDLTVETRVSVDPRVGYQAAGLLLFADEHNYVRLERGYGDIDAIAFEYFTNSEHHKLTTPYGGEPQAKVRTTADTVSLRLERTGGQVTAQWRAAESEPWKDLPGAAPFPSGNARAGMTVLNAPETGQLSATFRHLTINCLVTAPGASPPT
ncbi:protein kinase domain-containing protein [Yinghuangia sp. YIM S09857]|uniref:protein kinase domain-containing protein n=1 Tax=Yinghuangia sp. YIM S09857 TaxID=3436929 RepID=UPI003F52A62A